jgi:DNA-binding beta-propeller fold protein YncE
LPHARSGRGTFTVACTGSKVWVANARTGQVLSIPTGPGLSDTVTYPVRHATWVSAAGGVVWVTDGVDRELVEIDAATDKRLEAVPLSRYPTTIAARPGYAWIGFRSRPFL